MTTIKFANYTPHSINIFRDEDTEFIPALRKAILKEGAEPILVIPPTGKLLNAQMGNTEIKPSLKKEYPFLVGGTKFIGADEIPMADHEAGTRFIVSALYCSAVKELAPHLVEWLVTVSRPVYSPDGKTVLGCLELAINEEMPGIPEHLKTMLKESQDPTVLEWLSLRGK